MFRLSENSGGCKIIIVLLILSLACSLRQPKPREIPGEAAPVEPVSKIPLPWQDDFEDGKLDGWIIQHDIDTKETTWLVENGLLVQGSAVSLKEKTPNNFLGTKIVAGDVNWGDYSIAARMLNRDNDGIGILFRYQNPDNYYRFMLLGDPLHAGPFCRLDKRVDGEFVILAEKYDFDTPEPSKPFSIGIDVRGDSIATLVAGKRIFRVQDKTFARGKIGFFCFENEDLCIDEIQVKASPIDFQAFEHDSIAFRVKTDHECGTYSFAVRGIVFEDINENNQQDIGEMGTPNIAVSDGRDVVFTNEHGIYSLPNNHRDVQFVFVSIPKAYKKSLNCYHLPHDSMGQRLFNFGLVPNSEPEKMPFSLVQVTDIHVHKPGDSLHFQETALECTEAIPTAKFMVATGDLVEKGSIGDQLATYAQVISEFPISFYSVFGNHDLDNGLNRLRNFHRFLGPDYFSFDFADCHIVSYNRIIPSEKQNEWLENDLTNCGRNKRILIFQHFPPTEEQLEKLLTFDVKAIFSGHWHSNKIIQYKGIMLYNTPPLRFGGIDNSPAGFRVVHVDWDTVYTHFHFGGVHNKMTVVYPAENCVHHEDSLNIMVNIYDTKSRARLVGYQLMKHPDFNEIGRLTQKNDWTWTKKIDGNLRDGQYELNLSAIAHNNQTWQTTVRFSVHAGKQLQISPEEAWPMFKKDRLHSGISRSPLKPPLRIAWIHSTEGTVDFAAPVYHQNRVFLAIKDRDNLENNYVCALNALTGELHWCFETPSAVNHSLAIHQKKVIAQDVQGHIFALEEDTGEIAWQQTLCEDETQFWLYSAPIATDGTCFVGNAAGLAALSAESGNVLWRKQLGRHWISSYATASYYRGILFVGAMWDERNLYALNAMNGQLLWDFNSPGTHASALVDEGVVYTGTEYGDLIAIRAQSGIEIWRTFLGDGWAPTSPTAIDSIILAGSGNGKMVAVNRNDGKIVWKFQCAESPVRISPYRNSFQALTGSPVVAANTVYFGSSDGHLYALNLSDGKLLWKHNFGAPILSTPAITGNALFITAYDGNIYALVSDE